MPISVKSQIDFNKIETKNLVLENRLSTDPPVVSPHAGQIYFETDTGKLKIYNVKSGDWEETSGVALVDVTTLPTTNINKNVIYRLAKNGYMYNNSFITQDTVTCYSVDGTVITISTTGLTNNTDTENPVVYNWEDLTDAIIESFGSNVEVVNFVKDTNHFCKYNIDQYDIANKFEPYTNYELYHNIDGTTNGWVLLSSTEDGTQYSSLSGKPKINNIEIIGNQSDSYYHISKELTEEEYNNLSNEEKNNGTAYYIDAGGTSSNVNETNYNNLTSKPSINGVTLQQGQTANDLDIYTRSQVDAKMSGIFKYKGVVATISNLPSSTSKAGDCYYVTAETSTYAFNGSAWESIGSTVDLTNYQTSTDNSLETTSKTIVGGINELNADKVNISSIVDNLTTTATNVPLSANQGKVLNDKVELRELLSNKTTTIGNSSTDTEYPSAKAVYDSFAPISTTKYVGIFKSPNDCIVPFGFHRILNMSNERATIEGLFVSQMIDPVDNSSNLFGDLKVRQQCYGGSTAGSATNICIEQTFETYLRGSPTQRKVFFRRGYLANSGTDIDINNVEAIKNSLTWMSWYPVEYPRVILSKEETATTVTIFDAKACVSNGICFINVRHIRTNTDLARSSSIAIATCPFSPFRKENDLYFGTLYSFDNTVSAPAALQAINDSKLEAFGFKANIRYIGTISFPLGY